MRSHKRRIVRAALVALAAGGLVAVANPVPTAAHDAAVALISAAKLTTSAAAFARAHLGGAVSDLA